MLLEVAPSHSNPRGEVPHWRWLGGKTPLPQSRLVPAGDPPAFERDDHGNAVGGVRLPELEAPLGHARRTESTGALLNVAGSGTQFPRKVVDQLDGTLDDGWRASEPLSITSLRPGSSPRTTRP